MTETIKRTGVLRVAVLLALCASCRDQATEQVDFDELPYVQQTHHAQLREELARLEAERATPQLLDVSPATDGGETHQARAQRLTEQLNGICPVQNLRSTLERIKLFYPHDAFRFDPVTLEQAREVAKRCATLLDQYRALFQGDGFQFDVSLRDGLLADLTVLDHAVLAHRLEALSAADALASGEPSAALLPLRNMFRIDVRLSALANVAARSTAATLRAEAFAVSAALVEHPQCAPELHGELLQVLQNQLDEWTPDRVVWVGDRALGLHAYELVRDGQLLNILTQEEIKRLEQEESLGAFDKAMLKSLDDDQWFYLSTMRRVIDACDQPYFQRLPLFEKINEELTRLQKTPRYPLFAAGVLLPNLGAVQRELAIDRARCEAWVLALRAASRTTIAEPGTNPVTGVSYNLVREGDTIVIRNLTGERDEKPAVAIPLLAP